MAENFDIQAYNAAFQDFLNKLIASRGQTIPAEGSGSDQGQGQQGGSPSVAETAAKSAVKTAAKRAAKRWLAGDSVASTEAENTAFNASANAASAEAAAEAQAAWNAAGAEAAGNATVGSSIPYAPWLSETGGEVGGEVGGQSLATGGAEIGSEAGAQGAAEGGSAAAGSTPVGYGTWGNLGAGALLAAVIPAGKAIQSHWFRGNRRDYTPYDADRIINRSPETSPFNHQIAGWQNASYDQKKALLDRLNFDRAVSWPENYKENHGPRDQSKNQAYLDFRELGSSSQRARDSHMFSHDEMQPWQIKAYEKAHPWNYQTPLNDWIPTEDFLKTNHKFNQSGADDQWRILDSIKALKEFGQAAPTPEAAAASVPQTYEQIYGHRDWGKYR